jgi:hypothetical protein
LYEINNKNSFWKAFNSYKNGDKSSSYSDSRVNDLLIHFKKLFHSINEEITDDNQRLKWNWIFKIISLILRKINILFKFYIKKSIKIEEFYTKKMNFIIRK